MYWTREDTERWLNDYPLPADMTFRGEKVWPRYALKKGYGFWLRTAGPYHVAMRGLFALIHQFLEEVPVGSPMPTGEILMAKVNHWERLQQDLPLTIEDQAAPAPKNPAEETEPEEII